MCENTKNGGLQCAIRLPKHERGNFISDIIMATNDLNSLTKYTVLSFVLSLDYGNEQEVINPVHNLEAHYKH